MRLLLIEDSSRLRWSLVLGLKGAGHTVDEAGDGTEGLWKAVTGKYDLLILDIMLPGMDGLEILKRLRNQGNQTHVLFLTARDGVENRIKGLSAGADDYLVKPFDLGELLARVQALCRRSYARKAPRLEIADLVIDLNSLEAWISGIKMELLPREFRILQLLALREGQVISRPEIEQNIYADSVELMSNTVESAISNIRRKLVQAGSRVQIETKRRFGYRLVALPTT